MVTNLNSLLNTMVPTIINFESKVAAMVKKVTPSIRKERKRKLEIMEAEKLLFKRKVEERAARNLIEKKMVETRKNSRRKIKTLVVDYNQLVTIRINAKTYIYSKPGEEAKTKATFLQNYSKFLKQTDQNLNS